MRLKHDGFSDPITLTIVALAVAVGCYFMFRSSAIDAPGEQAAEAVLKMEGIDIDFSAAKKSNSQVQGSADSHK